MNSTSICHAHKQFRKAALHTYHNTVAGKCTASAGMGKIITGQLYQERDVLLVTLRTAKGAGTESGEREINRSAAFWREDLCRESP